MSAYHTISAPLHLFLACFPSQQPPPSMVTPQMVRSQTVMAATPLATLTTLWLCSSRSWRAVLCSAGSRLRCAPLAHHKSSAFARWDTPHITWHSWWRFRSMDRFMICKWNKKEMFAEITLNHLHRNQQDKMLKIPLLKLTFWSPKLQLCCVVCQLSDSGSARKLLSDTETLRRILHEADSLLKMFWRAALPDSEETKQVRTNTEAKVSCFHPLICWSSQCPLSILMLHPSHHMINSHQIDDKNEHFEQTSVWKQRPTNQLCHLTQA